MFTLKLGDPGGESTTTVKAELRRLMLENIHTDAGQIVDENHYRQHPHAEHFDRRPRRFEGARSHDRSMGVGWEAHAGI